MVLGGKGMGKKLGRCQGGAGWEASPELGLVELRAWSSHWAVGWVVLLMVILPPPPSLTMVSSLCPS